MAKTVAAAAVLALGLTGCSVYHEATATRPPPDARWQQVATDADRIRLRQWRRAWDEALPKARAAEPDAIAGNPFLFDPDRALTAPVPPPGRYRCRTYKLAAQSPGMRDFTAYPWFECRVADEGEVTSFHKRTGSQRPTGLIFTDTPSRGIFIGTLVLGDETAPLRYGIDADRDMIGYVERIDTRRWRLVLPRPRFETVLDILELVPAE